MENIKKQLVDIQIPVSATDWDKLASSLNKNQLQKKKKRGLQKLILTAAAALTLLLAAYLVFQWPHDNTMELVISTYPEDLNNSPSLLLANKSILSHRNKVTANASNAISSLPGSLMPYFANLPNGDQWLVRLSLVRENNQCTASIHTINDKPFSLEMMGKDAECIVFLSSEKDASIQLLENGDQPVLLLVLNQSTGGLTDELALELHPIY